MKFLLLALAAFASLTAPTAHACGVKVVPDITFAPGLQMDAYLPQGCGDRVYPVEMIHGGGFKSGKRQDADNVRLSHDLAAKGFAVFSVDYRLSTERPVLETIPAARAAEIVRQIGDPQAYYALVAAEDAAKARAFVEANAADFGVTRKRWGLVGTSAGAITAMITAYAGDDYWGRRFRPIGAVVDLWGMVPAETIDAGEPPVLIVHGTADRLVKYDTTIAIVKRAGVVGVKVELFTLPGAGHEDGQRLIYTVPAPGGVIADRISTFLLENVPR